MSVERDSERHEFSEWHTALQGFSEFYGTEIRPALIEHEATRHRVVQGTRLAATAAIAIGSGLFFGGEWLAEHLIFEPGFYHLVGGLGGVGGLVWVYQDYARLVGSIKLLLMEKICTFLGLDFAFYPKTSPLPAFNALSLLPPYDAGSLEDEISGERHGVAFSLTEARLTKKAGKSNRTAFRGFLIALTFERSFKGLTVLTEDEGWFGSLFGSDGLGRERVALEDPQFEKAFDVFGSDQVESRYLLTPTLMEKLLHLSNGVGHGNLTMAFHGNSVLLAIQRGKDHFETGPLTESLDNPRAVQTLLDDIAIALWIVDSVSLALERYR